MISGINAVGIDECVNSSKERARLFALSMWRKQVRVWRRAIESFWSKWAQLDMLSMDSGSGWLDFVDGGLPVS